MACFHVETKGQATHERIRRNFYAVTFNAVSFSSYIWTNELVELECLYIVKLEKGPKYNRYTHINTQKYYFTMFYRITQPNARIYIYIYIYIFFHSLYFSKTRIDFSIHLFYVSSLFEYFYAASTVNAHIYYDVNFKACVLGHCGVLVLTGILSYNK